MINLICAIDKNNGIGYKNQLLFHDKEDLSSFKKLTWGKTIVMGRKTWDSLPKKPLPNRVHIVLSNSIQESSGLVYITDFETFQKAYDPKLEYWVLGGGEIYKKFLEENLVDSVYLSIFDKESNKVDTYFPKEYMENFKLDSENNYTNFKLQIWKR